MSKQALQGIPQQGGGTGENPPLAGGGIPGGQNAAVMDGGLMPHLGDQVLAARHRTTNRIAMPTKVLGDRMHYQIDAKGGMILPQRRGKGRIARDQRPRIMRDLRRIINLWTFSVVLSCYFFHFACFCSWKLGTRRTLTYAAVHRRNGIKEHGTTCLALHHIKR